MTQKEQVLAKLKGAGKEGVSSKVFIADYMPRAAARVQELKDEGFNIVSEREGKYTRYKLETPFCSRCKTPMVKRSTDPRGYCGFCIEENADTLSPQENSLDSETLFNAPRKRKQKTSMYDPENTA